MKFRYSKAPTTRTSDSEQWQSPRAKQYLVKAAECERLSHSTLDDSIKRMYFDLVRHWQDLADEAEKLDRKHYSGFIDPNQ
jgi:hypothetical protein